LKIGLQVENLPHQIQAYTLEKYRSPDLKKASR